MCFETRLTRNGREPGSENYCGKADSPSNRTAFREGGAEQNRSANSCTYDGVSIRTSAAGARGRRGRALDLNIQLISDGRLKLKRPGCARVVTSAIIQRRHYKPRPALRSRAPPTRTNRISV